MPDAASIIRIGLAVAQLAARFPWEQSLVKKPESDLSPLHALAKQHTAHGVETTQEAQEEAQEEAQGTREGDTRVEEAPEMGVEHEHSHAGVSTEETLAYQNRELAKHLMAVEVHLAQGCRIASKPCDCCSGRHPLAMEMLTEEAISMSPDSVYHEVQVLAREIEAKANTEAVASAQFTGEYPEMARRARDLRKRLYTPTSRPQEKEETA